MTKNECNAQNYLFFILFIGLWRHNKRLYLYNFTPCLKKTFEEKKTQREWNRKKICSFCCMIIPSHFIKSCEPPFPPPPPPKKKKKKKKWWKCLDLNVIFTWHCRQVLALYKSPCLFNPFPNKCRKRRNCF